MKSLKRFLFVLLLGAGGGAAGMFYGRAPVEQYLGLAGTEVEAEVIEERVEEERLVLVLRAEHDTMLATFRQRADDVAMLVEVGDRIVFRTRGDVFADDIPIVRVIRGAAAAEPSDESPSAEGETSAEDPTVGEGESEDEGDGESEDEELTEGISSNEAEVAEDSAA